jgi:acyl dehydratase
MPEFQTADDLRAAKGQHLGHSDWVEITQQRVDRFADATGDHQWIHVDPEKAAKGPFGTTVAHGYLTLALVPMLASEVSRVDGAKMGVNYGSNKVRFPAPLPTGSKVRAGVKLLSVEDVPGGVQVINEVTIEREGGDKPCCVGEIVSRVYF